MSECMQKSTTSALSARPKPCSLHQPENRERERTTPISEKIEHSPNNIVQINLASKKSIKSLATCDRSPTNPVHDDSYNPWVPFLQSTSDAPPPYTQHPQSNTLPSALNFQLQMALAQQQMEQAAQQLRKVSLEEADREHYSMERGHVLEKRERKAAYKQAREMHKEACRKSDHVLEDMTANVHETRCEHNYANCP